MTKGIDNDIQYTEKTLISYKSTPYIQFLQFKKIDLGNFFLSQENYLNVIFVNQNTRIRLCKG